MAVVQSEQIGGHSSDGAVVLRDGRLEPYTSILYIYIYIYIYTLTHIHTYIYTKSVYAQIKCQYINVSPCVSVAYQ